MSEVLLNSEPFADKLQVLLVANNNIWTIIDSSPLFKHERFRATLVLNSLVLVIPVVLITILMIKRWNRVRPLFLGHLELIRGVTVRCIDRLADHTIEWVRLYPSCVAIISWRLLLLRWDNLGLRVVIHGSFVAEGLIQSFALSNRVSEYIIFNFLRFDPCVSIPFWFLSIDGTRYLRIHSSESCPIGANRGPFVWVLDMLVKVLIPCNCLEVGLNHVLAKLGFWGELFLLIFF